MINIETIEFIREHRDDDVRKLAFLGSRYPKVDLPYALDQIAGWQTAKEKLSSWVDNVDVDDYDNTTTKCYNENRTNFIIFPPHISMEQCSSELTGRYKREVMEEWLTKKFGESLTSGPDPDVSEKFGESSTVFYDLTAGFGVDFSFLAPLFDRAVYVEKQAHLCEIARHNLPLLGLKDATILNCDAKEVYPTISPITGSDPMIGLFHTFVFLDPARRDSKGGRTYAIGDCTPNILEFIDELVEKCDVVMVKLSPMLDWHAAVADINAATKNGDVVREVHIVSVKNECKELLLVISGRNSEPLTVVCADLPGNRFVVDGSEFKDEGSEFSPWQANKLERKDECVDIDKYMVGRYLMVPNASVMKAGCFKAIESRFGIRQISVNSHLFVSTDDVEGFPGRKFEIILVSSMNKKELRLSLNGIESANISTRNFPLTPEQLRKRLKLKDGGDVYIFATTTAKNEHCLFICKKSPLLSNNK